MICPIFCTAEIESVAHGFGNSPKSETTMRILEKMDEPVISTSFETVRNRKTLALAQIVASSWRGTPKNCLVVGCGTGEEAGLLARHLKLETIGIDIGSEFPFDQDRAAPAKLEIMDAHALKFPDSSFDVVYSFHALEHITAPTVALREMARVLKPGGTYVIGTPNKSRLVGYMGAATSLTNKVKWNAHDWLARLRGKWRNEAGAHAGFTERELISMSSLAFESKAMSISDGYYSALYGEKVVRRLKRLKLTRNLYPCVYVIGWGKDMVEG